MSTLRVVHPAGFLLGHEPIHPSEGGESVLSTASPRHHDPPEDVAGEAIAHFVESAVETLAVHRFSSCPVFYIGILPFTT